jgi:hypothetical protein
MKKMENAAGSEMLSKAVPQQPADAGHTYPFGTGAYSKEHLDYIIKTHQPYYSYPMTYEDAHEIVSTYLALYAVLKED